MAGGLFSRINTRTTGNTIEGPDDDADFDNIINNLLPAKFDDYSLNNAQMQSTRDPFPGDTISLATNLSEELEGIRFVLKEAFGSADWFRSTTLLPLSGGTMTGAIVLSAGTEAAPAVGWTDTGFFESSTDTVGVSIAGALTWIMDAVSLGSNINSGARILSETTSSTNPVIIPFANDLTTGRGAAISGELSDIVSGVEIVNISSTGVLGGLSLQTETATTSGTTIDYTGIDSKVKRITIMFNGVSTDGVEALLLQLGDAGGFETSGYIGKTAIILATPVFADHGAGFLLNEASVATDTVYGTITLTMQDSANNGWTLSGNLANVVGVEVYAIAGYKELTAALTQIRLTTANTPDDFDGGSINVIYE